MFDEDLFDHMTPRGTVEHTLEGVYIPRTNPNPVVLTLKFAGRGSPYWGAITKAKPLHDKDAATARAASLFAKHGVAGWKNVEKDGQPVAYTPELGAEVFAKLIKAKRGEIVDNALGMAMNPDLFGEPVVSADDVGKG